MWRETQWRYCNNQKHGAHEQEEKVNNAAGSRSCRRTCFLEPVVDQTACKMLSVFHICQDSEEKIRQNASHLDRMENEVHHLSRNTDDTIHILGNENLKQQVKTTNENYLELYSWELWNRRASH